MLKRVYLEITNSCNLNCPFCTNEKGHDFMPISQIEDYIKQIKKHCDYIYLHVLGEPLLHPDFDKILTILDDNNMKLQLVTNGTLLNKYHDLLQHPCLRKLSISIHSINNTNQYTDYFDTITEIINKTTNVNIELRFYDYDNLDKNIKDYLSFLQNKYNYIETSKKNSYQIKDNVYVYYEDIFKWPSIEDSIISDIGTCHGGIDMIAINCKSDVTLCCLDPKAENKIGNLKENSLDEILNSDIYKKYIDDFKNKKITAPLCLRCSYRQRFKL